MMDHFPCNQLNDPLKVCRLNRMLCCLLLATSRLLELLVISMANV